MDAAEMSEFMSERVFEELRVSRGRGKPEECSAG
jgi:hypothetical protein